MKITFLELEQWEEEYIRSKLKKHSLTFSKEPLTEKNAEKFKDSDIISVFINCSVNKKTLSTFKKLKFVTTMSTGYDHIDIKSCKSNNLKVSYVPSYGENTVAEHTFGLILSLSKRIPESIERTKEDDFSLKDLMGFDLKNKTLGVIGPGKIGQHVIKMANAFEMKVIAYSPHEDKNLAKKLNFEYVTFNGLLKNSDILTIHVPLTPQTNHMINSKNINLIKKGAYLINTSRGAIIETSALLQALDKKILAGAALDVLEGECEIKEERELLSNSLKCDLKIMLENHILLKNKNVLITPHSAFYTKEALIRILDTTIGNIDAFIKKQPMNSIP